MIEKIIMLLKNDDLSLNIKRVIISNYFSEICRDESMLKLLQTRDLVPELRVELIEHFRNPLYLSDSSLNEKIVPVLESIVELPMKYEPMVSQSAIVSLSFYGSSYVIDRLGMYSLLIMEDQRYYGPIAEHLINIVSFEPYRMDPIVRSLYEIVSEKNKSVIVSAKLLLDIVYKHYEHHSATKAKESFIEMLTKLEKYTNIDELRQQFSEFKRQIGCDSVVLFDINKNLKTYYYHVGIDDDYKYKSETIRLDVDDPIGRVALLGGAPLVIDKDGADNSFLARFRDVFNYALLVPCSCKGDISVILVVLSGKKIEVDGLVATFALSKHLGTSIMKFKDVVDLIHLYDKLSSDYSIMIRGLRHDVKNPLGEIVNNLFAMKLDSAITGKNIERMSSCDNATQVIKDALENLVLVVDPAAKDRTVNEIIEMVAKALDYSISENKIQLKTSFDKENPKVSMSTGLTRVILNLLMNSIEALAQHISAKKEIEIKTSYSATESLLNIEVRDNGPGISDIVKDRIFEPFVSTTGSGLGLYIVNNIIKSARGSVKCETSSAGSIFKITIPVGV